VTRTENYKKIGGFDEDFFLYLEDADFTDRMQALGDTVFYPDANVIHAWSAGSRRNLRLFLIHIRSMFLYMRKKRRNARRLRRIQAKKR
jgi:GT2 family glycosyltransferase